MDISKVKQTAYDWVGIHHSEISEWHQLIWHFAETSWREYKSANWYVEKLRAEGFEVEAGSAGMPTAFCATFKNGEGPTLGTYAEYDAVPGNCQAAIPRCQPRAGLSPHAPGHTDPHSGLGIGSLAGLLATKAAMEQHGISGSLRYLGEPAEKVRGSKPIHAAQGYYDGLDAMISFHPAYMLPLSNTARWDTHCGAGYARIFTFECKSPETWMVANVSGPFAVAHVASRAPGANDALFNFYGLNKSAGSMLPFTQGWSISDAILTAGQATADNLSHSIAQIQYLWRTPTIEQAETISSVLEHNARSAAQAAHCELRMDWVSKSRPGLSNHVMAQLTYENLVKAGPPNFSEEAIKIAQTIQSELDIEVMDKPFSPACENLIEPKDAEAILRKDLPPSQLNTTSDDYTDMTWHCPTSRFYVGRPILSAPNGYRYPDWVTTAMGGIPETIDPMIFSAGRTIAGTLIDLLADKKHLADAWKEFNERTDGGINGKQWIPPLCDYDPPINFRWPEYVKTERGEDWCIPDFS